jgi:hypothetical protein
MEPSMRVTTVCVVAVRIVDAMTLRVLTARGLPSVRLRRHLSFLSQFFPFDFVDQIDIA